MSIGGLTLDRSVARFRQARLTFFEYRYEADITRKTTLALGFAALTGLAAQIRVPLPFTPVPVTGQTFAVLLAGIILGARFGGLSQGLYGGLGVAGVPWFQGFGGGLSHVLGPTGGYIVGFIVAAVFVGYLSDRFVTARRFPLLIGILLVANFVVIYGIGLAWLGAWLTFIKAAPPTAIELLELGAIPFIPGDLVKLGAAALVGRAITPGDDFTPSD